MARSKYKIAPVGAVFGKWTVLGYAHYDNEHYWTVQCGGCGGTFVRRASQLSLGRSGGCQKCNAKVREQYHFWKGLDGISIQYLSRLKYRGKEVTISLEDLVEQWRLQKGICPYSGEALFLAIKDSGWKSSSASIDRIDSSKGYIKGNIQWVHKRVNSMKSDMPEEDFLLWCEKITQNRKCGV